MAGERRLRQVEVVGQLAGCHIPLAQQLEDAAAGWVRDGFVNTIHGLMFAISLTTEL